MSERVKQAAEYCRKHNQEHLADYLKPVFSQKSDQLARQILSTDLEQIARIYHELVLNINNGNGNRDGVLSPIASFDKSAAPKSDIRGMTELGDAAIRRGEVAVVTMAGGQGTRLGFAGPKGTFLLVTEPPRSLFEIQCGQLLQIRERTDVTVPWLIMTSEENHDATVQFFREQDYFGYDTAKVRFFPQEMVPILDFDGKAIVNESGLALAPNGNGGVFSSLKKSGEYQRLKDEGITRVFLCGIDNALVKIADPFFIGFSIRNGSPITCKSVVKRSHDEKAGIFCRKDGKPSYIEYTEIPPDQAKARDEKGNFVFGDVGIVMYVFTMEILDRIAAFPLPYHIAKKATPFLRPDGVAVKPDHPNSIKFETFIFDSFHMVEDLSVLRVPREEEFAPIKNRTGEDSPRTALDLYLAQH